MTFDIHKLNYLLICIFPLIYITGPFLPDAIISFIALFYLFYIFYYKKWDDFKSRLVILIFFFWIYCLLRSLLSENPLLSLEHSLFYIRFLFFALAVNFYLLKFDKMKYHVGISLWFVTVFVTFDGLLQYFTGFNTLNFRADEYRISGIFGEEYVLGSYLSRVMPFCFYFLAISNNLGKKFFIIAMFFLILVDVLIFFAGERTAFFYLILGTAIIVLLTRKYKLIRAVAFLLSILIILISVFQLPLLKKRMVNYTLEQIGVSENENKIKAFSIEHELHFRSAIEMFKDNIIFGHGPKMFRELCKKEKYYPEGCSTHPHNIYLQLLLETGLIGISFVLVIFISIVIIFIRQFLGIINISKSFYVDDAKICLLAAFFIFLWPLIPTGSFYNNWLNSLVYLALGFYLFENSKLNNYRDN